MTLSLNKYVLKICCKGAKEVIEYQYNLNGSYSQFATQASQTAMKACVCRRC